jgi:hypothetical protein
MSSEFVTIDRLRKDDASSKTARMSWFAASSWTISRREKTIFTSSLERHRFMLLLKKCESTHHKYPILFPMHVLFNDSIVKFFLLTIQQKNNLDTLSRLFFLYFAKFWTC